jgi:Mlc titration factor MtfA (ptsG expression regulator)
MLGFFRARRRARLRARPFPPAWRAIVERNFPLFQRLPERDRAELLGHVQVFLAEKQFEGCGGLELTDEIRVTIAAHACLLLLHRDDDYYPRLLSILVYPAAYVAPQREVGPDGVVHEGVSGRLGESWQDGALVLSWDDVHGHAADLDVPHDVVLHEFAHQLDQEDGRADGAPILPARRMYAAWARVLSREFERLRDDAVRGRRSVLDTYGATNPAEFFAVATEAFFKNAERMRTRHPELYAELREFYRQDPAAYA